MKESGGLANERSPKSTRLYRLNIVKAAEGGSVQWLIGVLARIGNIQNEN